MDILMTEVHDTCIEAEKCKTNFGSGLFHLRIGAIDQAIFWQGQYMKVRMGKVPLAPTSEARNIADEAGKAEEGAFEKVGAEEKAKVVSWCMVIAEIEKSWPWTKESNGVVDQIQYKLSQMKTADDAEMQSINALFGTRSDVDARRKKDQADLKALYERYENEIAMGIDLTVAKFDEAHKDHDDVGFAEWPLTFGKIVKRAYEMQLRKVRDKLEENRLIDKSGEALGVADVRDYVCNLKAMLLAIGKS